jgi:hypothetical protein
LQKWILLEWVKYYATGFLFETLLFCLLLSLSLFKERKMTQYWQFDKEPLESDEYWRQAKEYLAEE